jgi:hypothetical protein
MTTFAWRQGHRRDSRLHAFDVDVPLCSHAPRFETGAAHPIKEGAVPKGACRFCHREVIKRRVEESEAAQ